MAGVFSEIVQWVETLPYWEQAAFEKMFLGVQCAEADYDELVQYLLEDAGLAPITSERRDLQFKNATTGPESTSGKVKILQLSNMQNVNALVPGQTLTFGPAITAIFGANASGKSGYARVLGCAGFTRGDKEVLPDITKSLTTPAVLSADITVSDGTATKVVPYEIGRPCPELAQFYVFDSTSVIRHLMVSNKFSFSPASLFYLTQLADITDKVRERLRIRIVECNQPHNFGILFVGESAVADLIANLSPKTSIQELAQLATLTPEEHTHIKELDKQIAELKVRDTLKQIGTIKQTIQDLANLAKRLHEIGEKVCDDAISGIAQAVEGRIEKESAAQRFSIDQFKSAHFTKTGNDVWYQFARAAKTLAEAEQSTNKPYPQPDDYCLLCQQPLTPEARNLLLRLWDFLRGEAQASLSQALANLAGKRGELDKLNLDFFNDQSVSYRHLELHDKELLAQVARFVKVCQKRREIALKLIDSSLVEEAIPQMPDNGIDKINELVKMLDKEREKLEKENREEEIIKLEKQLVSLQHREKLGQHLPQIEAYVHKTIWAQKASKIGGSTGHITIKHNALFRILVTDRYIELFERTLKDLKRPLRVKIDTMGHKGTTYKQIILEAAATVADVTPDKVLSEGEKRAVALADFLTEVALDTTSSGIILDDPVTSLDLEWRETIAYMLAEEAKRRQVIVFTHDLPFLYFLKKHAEERGIDLISHWIKRGEYDDKPGYVYCNNCPTLERDYRTASQARELYKRAKGTPPEEQERLLRDGFGALRTAYEAFIIFDLFKGVVIRFEERVSFLRLKEIQWDQSIANEVVGKCEYLSGYIEGHLHSDALGTIKLKPEMLIGEIEAFDSLRKRLSQLKAK